MLTDTMLQHVRSCVTDACFETWFKELSFEIVDGGALRVIAPNAHIRTWVESHYRKELTAAAERVMPECKALYFSVRSAARAPETSTSISKSLAESEAAVNAAQRVASIESATPGAFEMHLQGLPLCTRLRLENFCVGACNRLAYAAAQNVVAMPANFYNPLYVFGGHGNGKTHLLQGIGNAITQRNPSSRVIFISSEEFTNAYIRALQNKRIDAFRSRFRSCDVLLIDDIHFLAGREKTLEEMLYTFDALRNVNKQVIISANAAPRDIKKMDDRLTARFQAGLVVRIDAPDVEVRTRLLKGIAAIRGHELSPEAADVLASHIDKSVRELEGVICKLLALSAAEQRKPDRELAIMALRELGYLRSGPLTLLDILNAVTQACGVSADQVRSGKRHASLVHVRHLGMYLSKLLTPHTVVEIGRFYGNRDHATVLHAARKITERVKHDENLKLEVQRLRQLLGR